jgi:hypothetical protein
MINFLMQMKQGNFSFDDQKTEKNLAEVEVELINRG